VRLTEFWNRMERRFGVTYARSFAADMVIAELSSRTVLQALAEGDDVKSVWRAVCEATATPVSDR
jgi:hypothetical protein